ncbi:PAXNEB-domain-containing protein [Roridomyces roridus]|uniref:Elongator complex protein 4 n=1 Tax=Roridomyces roridus TaxID=1738132 RepID=A0AAD7BU87_9AGAR|nr:PAXNEB-domain-containing protein [Roridomyces roridus]
MSFTRKSKPASSSTQAAPFSTGLSSLDDLLGGGIPPSCSVVYTAPDLHSEYGVLLQKYFVAQGLATGEKIYVVGSTAEWVNECMWTPPNATTVEEADEADKLKIAWRYESMKQFETTVASSSSSRTFDLTVRIPPAVVSDALAKHQLVLVDAEAPARVLSRLKDVLATNTVPVRICIPSLGGPQWGDLGPQDILRFLHRLRALLRQYPQACASTSLVATVSGDSYGNGPGWHQRVGWVADGSMTLSAFSANPALAAAFPSAHALVRLHNLPSPHSLVPASDRFSVIRGASGENNISLKCTRKRVVFETMHLGVEGGVGERRTEATVTKKKAEKRVARFEGDAYDF